MQLVRFSHTDENHVLHLKGTFNSSTIYLIMYMDDMLIVGRDQVKIRMLKKALNRTICCLLAEMFVNL